ncbi:acetylserotonin O-methyltransferase [Pyxidicoccus caerfyrddinensis]|uniref:acetylserotonin O-methyltransferase n=1 Tax=Pyxidicoccus caerfyrddinensis TaxID=2709663 RepID=UPI001F0847D7|nr:acetylserotonin O-methyltransferase [Pyxidicoccus caerfyrddinensis]
MSDWAKTRVALDRTHHLLDGAPLYSERFTEVLSFHAPGLAAALDASGAFHIDTAGRAAYSRRFRRTFGFYEALAAVESEDGAFHVRPDGSALAGVRHAWCGNFQDGRCTVRGTDGRYFHIDREGSAVYGERYAYAGDYREGSAVVQEGSGLHLHIDRDGRPLNARRFLDLDVFHKGYARARDARGWHHVDRDGAPLYPHRFAAVEPFYNGQSRVEREDGALAVIDERGETVCELRPPSRTELEGLSGEMVGFWRTQTLCAAAELRILEVLPATVAHVAEQRALRPDRCARLLRALGEVGLVEREGDTWKVTRRGALLTPAHPMSLHDAALHWGRDCYGLWEELPAALRQDTRWEPPRFFEALAKAPERVASYHRAMATYARHDYTDLAEYLPELTRGVVLDAGGGSGTLLCELLRRRPELQGVLLERPEVARSVEVPPDLRERLTVLPGDFFAPWSVQADAVILARVLHDWDDADALRILHRAREALRPGGRVHVIEMLLEGVSGGLLDLHMLVTTGGRERTGAEFRKLFELAGLDAPLQRVPYGTRALLSTGVSQHGKEAANDSRVG